MFLLGILRCESLATHSGCRFLQFLYSNETLFSIQEFKKIRDFKRERCGIKCGDLEPWDEAYYTALMKSSTYNLDSSVSPALVFVLHVIYDGRGSFLLLYGNSQLSMLSLFPLMLQNRITLLSLLKHPIYFFLSFKFKDYMIFQLQVVASYFPLIQCIEGLKVLVKSLFGATFHSIPLAPGESWHEDVLKLSLHHPEEVST